MVIAGQRLLSLHDTPQVVHVFLRRRELTKHVFREITAQTREHSLERTERRTYAGIKVRAGGCSNARDKCRRG
ncbi:hypothetical protein D3C85_1765890 [compost metagenome]